MHLIVGLGNPDKQHLYNRHNIGFMVIDYFLNNYKTSSILKSTFKGQLFKFQDLLFLKPTTYMNLSGESVLAVKNFYKIEIENIIVIHDDLDLKFGAIKFKQGGGNGGHNGLKSIDKYISQNYKRVRIGIGKPDDKSKIINYVLENFNQDELEKLDIIIKHCFNSIKKLITEPLEKVASVYTKNLKNATL